MRFPSTYGLGLSILLCASRVSASVTVYGQVPLGQTVSGSAATPTFAAYDDTELIPPPVPSGFNTNFKIDLQSDAVNVPNLSIPHKAASFFGFSIEMSVISQIRKCYSRPSEPDKCNEEANVVGKNS
jgi:hypothetical protein